MVFVGAKPAPAVPVRCLAHLRPHGIEVDLVRDNADGVILVESHSLELPTPLNAAARCMRSTSRRLLDPLVLQQKLPVGDAVYHVIVRPKGLL